MASVIDPGTTTTTGARVTAPAPGPHPLGDGDRDALLHWSDDAARALPLGTADAAGVEALLAGRPVAVSRLLADVRDGRRRARAVARAARVLHEDHGLRALHLAVGMATWTPVAGPAPVAPVLIRPVRLDPVGPGHTDHLVVPEGELALNPALARHLAAAHGVGLDVAALEDIVDGEIDTVDAMARVRTWIAIQAREVTGFTVEDRSAIGLADPHRTAALRELEDGGAPHVDPLAALSGRPSARGHRDARPRPAADGTRALAVDTDASQAAAVAAVLAGEDVVVEAPPGTGATQTAAALVASLAAAGRTVLFVSPARAAVTDLVARLDAVGLADLVLDVDALPGSRRRAAAVLAAALEGTPEPAPGPERHGPEDLPALRERLQAHVSALHDVHAAWGLSLYGVRAAIAGETDAVDAGVRLDPAVLAGLGPAATRRAGRDVARLLELDGPDVMAGGSPWAAARLDDPTAARAASTTAHDLRTHVMPDALRALRACAEASGLPEAATAAGWSEHRELWTEAAAVAAVIDPAVFAAGPTALHARLERLRRGRLARLVALVLGRDLRAARRELRALSAIPGTDEPALLAALARAVALAERWRALAPEGRPVAVPGADEAGACHDALLASLGALSDPLGTDLAALGTGDAADLVARLADDAVTAGRIPEIRDLRRTLGHRGLLPLATALHDAGIPVERVPAAVRRTWLASLAEHLRVDGDGTHLAADALDEVVRRFAAADREALRAEAARVARRHARAVADARAAHPDQAGCVRTEARRRRGHRTPGELLAAAPDVLHALRPCWALAPRAVAATLPAAVRFDVVVIDEAGRVSVADAAPALRRAGRVVVLGDGARLAPPAGRAADGSPATLSVLEAAAPLPHHRLGTVHRGRDERITALLDAHVYGGGLAGVPSAGADDALRLVTVDYGRMDTEDSSAPEVERVARLVVAHGEARPGESIGVVALGPGHAVRVEERIRELLADRPDLAETFADTRPEPLAVRPASGAQGVARDAVILTIGYGRTADGGPSPVLGPLDGPDGERCLAAAIGCARRRLTVVSALGSADLDAARRAAPGVDLLARLLADLEAGGGRAREEVAPDAVERSVADALRGRGLAVHPRHGLSRTPVDLAVGRPGGPPLVAVELDGPRYAAVPDARDRERLRDEALVAAGWTVHRAWSDLWWDAPAAAADRVVRAVDEAMRRHEAARPAPAAAESGPPAPAAPPPATDPGPDGGAEAPATRPRCPIDIRRGSIRDYEHAELVVLARWLAGDGVARTEEETLRALMDLLGFRRLGMRIEQALLRAIRAA